MWLGYISITTLVADYVISREVNGFLQLLSFVGLVGILIILINKTQISFYLKKKKND
jgi:hypothetical protein